MIYGYARVSTDGQTLDAQLEQLKATGAGKDTLMVTRLDRLARSTRDLLNILAPLSQEGAAFRSLADDWARGKSLGRRPTLTPHQQAEARDRKAAGESVREIARSYHVCPQHNFAIP